MAARNHGMALEALRYDLTPTGLHYLLIHYDIPAVDPSTWLLHLDGEVESPLRLTLDELRKRSSVTQAVTLECAGNGRARLQPRPVSQPWVYEAVGTANWGGVPLAELLDEAEVGPDALEVLFTGLDRGIEGGFEQAYQRSLPLEEARRSDVIIAVTMNGEPLLPQHGAPARLLVPGWYGMTHVKWLDRITLITEPFDGYQQSHAYRVRHHEDEKGRAVTRIQPRSLIHPPGLPVFLSRDRVVDSGQVEIAGRAWSGFGAITRVEVSVDGGATWADAKLGEALGPYAWARWAWSWDAQPGIYQLCSRATDETGRSQPLDPEWNLGGYEVNAVHRIDVEVR